MVCLYLANIGNVALAQCLNILLHVTFHPFHKNKISVCVCEVGGGGRGEGKNHVIVHMQFGRDGPLKHFLRK